MSFRSTYARDLPVRALDVCLHVTAALAFPHFRVGWAMQWLPDCALIALWSRSMVLNRFAPASDPVLRFHRFLHTPLGYVSAALLTALCRPAYLGIMLYQYGAHLVIDLFTHGKEWK